MCLVHPVQCVYHWFLKILLAFYYYYLLWGVCVEITIGLLLLLFYAVSIDLSVLNICWSFNRSISPDSEACPVLSWCAHPFPIPIQLVYIKNRCCSAPHSPQTIKSSPDQNDYILLLLLVVYELIIGWFLLILLRRRSICVCPTLPCPNHATIPSIFHPFTPDLSLYLPF